MDPKYTAAAEKICDLLAKATESDMSAEDRAKVLPVIAEIVQVIATV